MARRRVPLLLARLAPIVAACGPTPMADVGYEEMAAWIRDAATDTDRPVVVKLFASWCLPCAEEAPVLLDVAADHPEVAFLGIDHQDPPDQAAAWIEEHGLDTIPTLADLEGETARAFGARGMPSVSFVDDRGQLLHTHTGPIDPGLLEAWIDHLAHDGPRPALRPDDLSTDSP